MHFKWNNAHPYRTVPARKNEFFHSGGRSDGEKWGKNKHYLSSSTTIDLAGKWIISVSPFNFAPLNSTG